MRTEVDVAWNGCRGYLIDNSSPPPIPILMQSLFIFHLSYWLLVDVLSSTSIEKWIISKKINRSIITNLGNIANFLYVTPGGILYVILQITITVDQIAKSVHPVIMKLDDYIKSIYRSSSDLSLHFFDDRRSARLLKDLTKFESFSVFSFFFESNSSQSSKIQAVCWNLFL